MSITRLYRLAALALVLFGLLLIALALLNVAGMGHAEGTMAGPLAVIIGGTALHAMRPKSTRNANRK